MILLVQRVSRASVAIEGETVARIGPGLLAFVGFERGDGARDIAAAARKLPSLRVFEDSAGKMNLSVTQGGGDILVVSQFTLAGSLERGARPSFDRALRADEARPLFDRFLAALRDAAPEIRVEAGRFQAVMDVELVNAGPVTLVWRSRPPADGDVA